MSRLRNIVLLVLLLVCAASFWFARQQSARPAPDGGRAIPEPVARGPIAAPIENVHIAVLNGTNEGGLARRVSRALSQLGCVVVSVADAPHDTFSATVLVNRRLPADRAEKLAAALGGPRLIREWDGRTGEDAVLVLGRDHARLGGPLRDR